MHNLADILGRLQHALPHVKKWMDALHAEHSHECIRASSLGFPRLASYFPRTLLDNAFAVPSDIMPFPPVREYGLPEFEAMANMPMKGITFGNMYFVRPTQSIEELHFHELIHVIQWSKLGIEQFLLTYGLGILQFGYEHSPFETIADEFQDGFQQATELPNVVEDVERHAIAMRDAAEVVFTQHGIEFGA
jgi:hypothetical protein